jgi:hypothetical protein
MIHPKNLDASSEMDMIPMNTLVKFRTGSKLKFYAEVPASQARLRISKRLDPPPWKPNPAIAVQRASRPYRHSNHHLHLHPRPFRDMVGARSPPSPAQHPAASM